jgi:hypothetical protein
MTPVATGLGLIAGASASGGGYADRVARSCGSATDRRLIVRRSGPASGPDRRPEIEAGSWQHA